MKKLFALTSAIALLSLGGIAEADVFGTGDNQFTMDFVNIVAGNTGSGVDYDYRIGTYEVTNDQWSKFKAAYGTVTGSSTGSYDKESYFTGANVPTNSISWYEAAQFVNYLNTSTGHQAAYKFTGTRGSSDYTFANWSASETDGINLYRNKNAVYVLPTQNEWKKAAYWNGTELQTYATKAGESLTQGDGTNHTGWNYCIPLTYSNDYATNPYGPWAAGSGSQELNGTYDMMGNVWEWMESPTFGNYAAPNYFREVRGGGWGSDYSNTVGSNYRYNAQPDFDGYNDYGLRVAYLAPVADVPEPSSIIAVFGLLAPAGLIFRRRKGGVVL